MSVGLERLTEYLLGLGGPWCDINRAKGTDTTTRATVGPAGPLARLVTPDYLARLALDLLGQHGIWHNCSRTR
jgi:hypothetical protein